MNHCAVAFLIAVCMAGSSACAVDAGDAQRLVAALRADTPLEEDLQSLSDEIGGRPTGSRANRAAVSWATQRFLAAGLAPKREAFDMPMAWLERRASAEIHSGTIRFSPRIAAMPYSTSTTNGGLTAPLLDGGHGSSTDFKRLGRRAKGAFVLIQTELLRDIDGLFAEYAEAAQLEPRAFAAGVAGVVYMGSRPGNQLYRHNASLGVHNTHPMLVMERDGATRALRLLHSGHALSLTVHLDLDRGGAYRAENVVAEIRGSEKPEQFVVIGAHLDSWGIGTGALDDGCNVALVIDIARQMHKLGLRPKRTIRFALFNGEEQGAYGSLGYTLIHAKELDRTVMASAYDIGSGRITGFFTAGRPALAHILDLALAPVADLGPFQQLDAPIVGTDNYDFMMQGVANLVANQESANYGPNYHARSDTFDKVDLKQLRKNAAVAAAVTWAFANQELELPRQRRAEIQRLIDATDLAEQMRMFGVLEDWNSATRGRRD